MSGDELTAKHPREKTKPGGRTSDEFNVPACDAFFKKISSDTNGRGILIAAFTNGCSYDDVLALVGKHLQDSGAASTKVPSVERMMVWMKSRYKNIESYVTHLRGTEENIDALSQKHVLEYLQEKILLNI
jgi:hypothetical protein